MLALDAWDRDALRALAATVLLDALSRSGDPWARAFLLHGEPWRSRRRLWLAVLGLEPEAAEAGFRRFLARPWAERQRRLAAGPDDGPPAPRRRQWDRDQAFPGALVTTRRVGGEREG